ncbi:MAG: hypothetical protein FWC47_13120 [Oscillospiraceae bacterium]|nr:hypothetical protein [Oscillospiraceae bacterium]
MKKFTKKISFITMMFLMFTALTINSAYAADKISYTKFSGTIIGETQGSQRIIIVQSVAGTKMEFNITTSTYVDKLAKIQTDSTVTCFYDKNEKKTSTYFTAITITDNPGVFLSKFDNNLLNAEKDLRISPNANTEIITKDGNIYTGDITNKTLLVFSVIVLETYPGQTTPYKIVVMDDISTPPATNNNSYQSFSGKVVQYQINASSRVVTITVQSTSGDSKTFMINGSTYLDNNVKITKNSNVTCFYKNNKSNASKINALAITNAPADTTVFLGKFDKNLVDENNVLKLLNTDKANVVTAKGKKYTGSLKNKVLLVFYTISTKSIPAQTNPTKIVVM